MCVCVCVCMCVFEFVCVCILCHVAVTCNKSELSHCQADQCEVSRDSAPVSPE